MAALVKSTNYTCRQESSSIIFTCPNLFAELLFCDQRCIHCFRTRSKLLKHEDDSNDKAMEQLEYPILPVILDQYYKIKMKASQEKALFNEFEIRNSKYLT